MEPELWGIITTYRRPEHLLRTLAVLADQTKRLDRLVIVDNGGGVGPLLENELSTPLAARTVTLLSEGRNVGPAGAVAAGMRHALEHAGTDDWLITFDDDDPPKSPDALERLWATAMQLLSTDRRCGAVGASGCRFDSRRTRVSRLPDSELTGKPVQVSTIGGGQLPMIRLAAVKDVGTYRPELFFGHEELEFFLRLQQGGWSAYADTALLLRYRSARGPLATRPSRRLGTPDWRRYYSIRNRVYIAYQTAGVRPALRVVAETAGKVLVNAPRDPREAALHAPLTARACVDGLRGRLGLTVVPELTANGRLPVRMRRKQRLHARQGDVT